MLKIYRAIKWEHITQPFGVNPVMYQRYGLKAHNGVDMAVFPCSQGLADTDTNKCAEIYCDTNIACKIIGLSYGLSEGLGITAISKEGQEIFMHRWWHFNKINPALKVGQTIETGDLLGWGGSTGISSGPHLHRDLHPMIENEYGHYIRKFGNDPYRGAIDPMTYYENVFVLDKINKLQKQISIAQRIIELLKRVLFLKGQIKK